MAGRKLDVSTDVTTDSTDETATSVTVTVERPYQVRYRGIVFIADETVEVDQDTAQLWTRAGFVRRTT